MNNKLCLGTVQFGLKYGINNVLDRQPDINECFDILDYAMAHGVTCFDTASGYGNAEQILGKYANFDSTVKIVSKLKPQVVASEVLQQSIVHDCQETLVRLNQKKLYGYLLHHAEDMYNNRVLDDLQKCKEVGLTENIGVSVYTPEEAMYAAKNTKLDFIQIPYNVLDQRLNFNGFFTVAKQHNIKVFARSAFLQGMLTLEIEKLEAKMPEAVAYIAKFDKICKSFGFTRKEAAFLFCYCHPAIDYVVFGVDTVAQLNENVTLIKRRECFQDCYKTLYGTFTNVKNEIINPSMWVNK